MVKMKKYQICCINCKFYYHMEARCSNEIPKSLIQFTDKGKQAQKN